MKLTLGRRGIIVLATGTVAAVSALVAPSIADTGPEQQLSVSASSGGIFVRGNEVRRRTGDGGSYKFKTRAVIVEGFQFPLEAMRTCHTKPGISDDAVAAAKRFCDRHVQAQDYYFHRGGFAGDSLDALQRAKRNWRANTVRFNLGQAMLDPDSSLFNRKDADGRLWGRNYMRNLKNAVAAARSRDMVVILPLFNYDRLVAAENVWVGGRSINSHDKKSGVPTYRTKRAMQRLATEFKGNNDVLLEVYNEPWGNPTNYVTDASHPGVNAIVRAARDRGKHNPIIVQGLLNSDLSSLPYSRLNDSKLIFAYHPFLGDGVRTGDGDANWSRLFGAAAKTRPVILTAWDANPVPKDGGNTWCRDFGPSVASDFIRYVKRREIGLAGFAFDVRYSMTKDFLNPDRRDAPTKLTAVRRDNGRWDCEGGGGELIKGLFAAYAS